jgi:hypothetical protein
MTRTRYLQELGGKYHGPRERIRQIGEIIKTSSGSEEIPNFEILEFVNDEESLQIHRLWSW